jgi:uncharacterized membrane protein
MNYNIHPIFVHFPIALLTIYSLIKILPVHKILKENQKTVERFLLFLGVVGAFFALNTGEMAEHIVRKNRQIIEAHSTFAGISTFVFGFLAILEISDILNKKNYLNKFKYVLNKLSLLSENKFLTIILSIIGLISIFMTGILGGMIVYGTSADPLAPIILKVLGLTI